MMILKQSLKDVYYSILVKSSLLPFRQNIRPGRIIILMYHRVNPERNVLGLSITPAFFDKQLSYLTSRFRVISLSESVILLSNEIPPGEQYVVITFDDGYRDNYDFAFPILCKYKVPATIFVTVEGLQTGNFGWNTFDQTILDSDCKFIDLAEFSLGLIDIRTRFEKEKAIVNLHQVLKRCAHDKREAVVNYIVNKYTKVAYGKRIMLTWAELREMQMSGLITIGSHTLTHPILTRIKPDRLREELVQSKFIIEEKLRVPVRFFAYPNGNKEDFDDEVVGELKTAGYTAACTTIHGSLISGVDPYRLPRVDVTFGMCQGIGGRFSPEMFASALSKGLL